MKRTVTTKEIAVPVDVMIEVADLLIENEISHVLVGTDEQEGTITISVQYDRDEREVIHEIDDIIDDHMEEDDSDDDQDDDDDDDSNHR